MFTWLGTNALRWGGGHEPAGPLRLVAQFPAPLTGPRVQQHLPEAA